MATGEVETWSGGYDEYFDPPLEGKYECPICLRGLREPVQTGCGHRFCKDCIIRSIRDAGPKCPLDNKHLSESQVSGPFDENRNQLYPDNFAKREMMDQGVFCRMKEQRGCTWKGKLGKLEEHLSNCDFVDVKCPKECGREMQRKDLKEHLEKECPNRTIPCKQCRKDIKWNELEDHYGECPKFPVKCDICKKENIPRGEIQEHLEKECTAVEMKCPFYFVGCAFENYRTPEDHFATDSSEEDESSLDSGDGDYIQEADQNYRISEDHFAADSNEEDESSLDLGDGDHIQLADQNYRTPEDYFATDSSEEDESSLDSGDGDYIQEADQNYRTPENHFATDSSEEDESSLDSGDGDHIQEADQNYQTPEDHYATDSSEEDESSLDSGDGDHVQEADQIPQVKCFESSGNKMTENFMNYRTPEDHYATDSSEEDYISLMPSLDSGDRNHTQETDQIPQVKCFESSGNKMAENFMNYRTPKDQYATDSSEEDESSLGSEDGDHIQEADQLLPNQAGAASMTDSQDMPPSRDAGSSCPVDNGRQSESRSDGAEYRHHISETLVARPNLLAFLRPTVLRNYKGYGYVEFAPIETIREPQYVRNNTMLVRIQVFH